MKCLSTLLLIISIFAFLLSSNNQQLVSAANSTTVYTKVSRCDNGFLQSVCPASHPVCCFQPLSQIWAACCPANSLCSLDEGICITYPSREALENATSKDDNSSSSPSSSNSYNPQADGGEKQALASGFDMSISIGAIVIACSAVVLIIGVAGAVAVGMWASLKYDLYRMRQEQQEDSSSSSSSSSVSSSENSGSEGGTSSAAGGAGGGGGGGNDDDEDDTPSGAECILCYTYKKDTVLLPCGHMVCCHRCSDRLADRGVCAICRKEIRATVRVPNKKELLKKQRQQQKEEREQRAAAAAKASNNEAAEVEVHSDRGEES